MADFLDPVPALRADSVRRLNEAPRPVFNADALRRMAPTARIAAIIDHLEDFNEQQFAQPGGIWFDRSPIFQMLAEQGADVIDPLLDVLDHDQRLTRAYSFGRNFLPPRHLVSVSEAAEVFLTEYYRLPTFRWKDPAERRAWLIRNKDRTPAQRAFDLLADDKNETIQWLDAARVLLAPAKGVPGVTGDELRGIEHPSLSELLVKRAMQANSWGDELALLCYEWDPPVALPALRRQMEQGRHYQGNAYASVIAALLQLGDPDAAKEWANVVKSNQAQQLVALVPLWIAPDNEAVQAVGRKLFTGPDAAMSPSRNAGDLIRSPLLRSPAYREGVLESLGSTSVMGTVERNPSGEVHVTTSSLSMVCQTSPNAGPATCGRGVQRDRIPGKRDIRTGDWAAYELSLIDGFPAFDLEASAEEKDSQIAATAAFLQQVRAGELQVPPVTETLPWMARVSFARK